MSKLVLASGSAIRRRILDGAGVSFSVDPARVDESELKQEMTDLSPADLALKLSEAKALDVSSRQPGRLVLGADQVMELEGRPLDKCPDQAAARARLIAMRGKPHHLRSGVTIARDGEIVWNLKSSASLWVRDFSEAFLDDYMDRAGEELTKGVGAYAFEGLGAQLFDRVEGDYYGVLGLPLLPVLAYLRTQGAAMS
jgi:septum formation protein